MKSRTSLKTGYVGSKTRSLGQILEKPCIRSRGHIFSPFIMKLCQNVCLDEISYQFENWSCQVKDLITRSNLRKILCTFWKTHFLSDFHETLSECLS